MNFIITDIFVVIASSHPVDILKDSTTPVLCKIKRTFKDLTRRRDI